MVHTETIVTGFDFSFFTFTDVAQNATVIKQFDLQNLIILSQIQREQLCEVKITQNVLEMLHSQEMPGRTYIKRTDVKPKNTMPPALATAKAETSKL